MERVNGNGNGKKKDASIADDEAAGSTVTVACKVPMGLWLQLWEMVERRENTPSGGSRSYQVAQKCGEAIRVNGPSSSWFGPAHHPEFDISGGYALTHNIAKSFWDTWLEQNRTSDIVKRKLIFAHGEKKSAKAFAREHQELKSGFEPVDRDHPERKLPAGFAVNRNSATAKMTVETVED